MSIAAPAVWADKTDFIVNDDGGSSEQNHPRIAVANNGSFVVVWEDRRNVSRDIYLQRYDSSGAKVGRNRRVNDDTIDAYQSEPAIAVDLTGLYSVVWKDYRTNVYPFDPDVFFQRFDSALSPSGANRTLTTEWPDSLKETPDIDLSPWGGGVVVWADYRNQNWDIYGQLISSDGSLIGSNFKVNSDNGNAQQHAPRVDISPEGWFVVAWYDNRKGNDDIFVQRYDSLANPLGVNMQINSDSQQKRQAFPDVACDGAGHFTVVWVDWRNGTYPANPDIYARKFGTDLVPVTSDTRVNSSDGTLRAQREPSISADRRGNVAIIWSDSTGSSWDIVGQMIDVNGTIQEANFQANFQGDSAQMQPDVALDGRYRYITWTDKRNGNYDIYASIVKYNDPTLIPSPSNLHFEMIDGEGLPAAKPVVLQHAGYNRLHFEAVVSQSWLAVTPTSGQTPDTLSVSIATDTLPFGTYFGGVTLIDLDNNDSSVVISVRLDVTAPMLSLSADSLHFSAFAGIDRDYTKNVTVRNAGGGSLNWSAAESADWLSLSPASGGDLTTVTLTVNASALTDGDYLEPVVFDAGAIMNSPDTLLVSVSVVSNQPYLLVDPDTIRISTTRPDTVAVAVHVTNAGVGILNWHSTIHDPWLHADRSSGLAGDSILLTINTTGLPYGSHGTWLDITDSAAFNITERIPVVLEYLEPSADTVFVGSSQTDLNTSATFALAMDIINDVNRLYLPLWYDTLRIVVDSVVIDPALPSLVAGAFEVDAAHEMFIVSLEAADGGLLSAGPSNLGVVHYTARDVPGQFAVMPPISASIAPYFVRSGGGYLMPVVQEGTIQVGTSTDVTEPTPEQLPQSYALQQNYPNPFNAGTIIEYSLPVGGRVTLELFNILGQRVRTLVEDALPAGDYRVEWDGALESGRGAPSGIYFYRMQSEGVSMVRKMVLVK